MSLPPLVFAEDRHEALWGFERWLVSAHPSAPSVVADGPFAGRRLDELVATFGDALAGVRAQGRFPVLIKDIVARQRLSVQVHPSETTAPLTGGEPKTEMWRVLDAAPEGALFAGVSPGTTREGLERAIANGGFEEVLRHQDAVVGEGVFIPGGLIHALGGGVRVIEVQQSSDTTYRLYDWGRVDANGQPRKLHVREGLAAADLGLVPVAVRGDFDCPFFRMRVLTPCAAMDVPANPDTFRVLFAEAGGFAVESDAGRHVVPEGNAILLPAVVGVRVIPLTASARLLLVSL